MSDDAEKLAELLKQAGATGVAVGATVLFTLNGYEVYISPTESYGHSELMISVDPIKQPPEDANPITCPRCGNEAQKNVIGGYFCTMPNCSWKCSKENAPTHLIKNFSEKPQ